MTALAALPDPAPASELSPVLPMTRVIQGVAILNALAGRQSPCTLTLITRELAMSMIRVEDLLRSLRHAGLIEARLGRTGGYVLAVPLGRLTLADVARAVRTPSDPALRRWTDDSAAGYDLAQRTASALEGALATIPLTQLR